MVLVNSIRIIILCFAIGVLPVSGIFAQQIFYSQSLQNLYYSLPNTCRFDSHTIDTVLLCCNVVQGDTVPIVYLFDKNEILEHIGYRFLPTDASVTENNIIVRFIERELLTWLTTSDLNQLFISYRENGLSVLRNDKPIIQNSLQNRKVLLSLLKNYQGISINFIDGIKYDVSLIFNKGQKLSFQFPADGDLLTGMDKKERDIRLAFQLKNHKAISDNVVEPDYGYLELLRDSIYIEKGSSFMIPQINNNIHYTKIDSAYSLVFDSLLLSETFSNTMIVPVNMNYTINIKHRIYGKQVEIYTVNNHDFNDFFRRNYDHYFGIETLEKDKLTGTLILNDPAVSCIHLAFVSTSLDAILKGGTMEIQLYSNIPRHNIKTLFGKQ